MGQKLHDENEGLGQITAGHERAAPEMKTVANSMGSSTQGRNQPGKGDASVPVNDICQKLLDLLTSAVSNSPDRQEGQVKGFGDVGNCGRFQVQNGLRQAKYLGR